MRPPPRAPSDRPGHPSAGAAPDGCSWAPSSRPASSVAAGVPVLVVPARPADAAGAARPTAVRHGLTPARRVGMWHDGPVTTRPVTWRRSCSVPVSGADPGTATLAPDGGHGVPDLPADLPVRRPTTGLTAAEADRAGTRGASATMPGSPPAGPTRRSCATTCSSRSTSCWPSSAWCWRRSSCTATRPSPSCWCSSTSWSGLVQEVRAKRSLDRLSVLTRPTATRHPGRRRA